VPNTGDSLALSGIISGSANFDKEGPGTVTFDGLSANTYSGTTFVDNGKLALACGYYLFSPPFFRFFPELGIPGPLQIGPNPTNATVYLEDNNQINATIPVQLNSGGLLDLNNYNATAGPLTFNGGEITTETGTLTLSSDVTILPGSSSAIVGQLSLGGTTRQFNFGTNSDIYNYAAISDGGSSSGITVNGGYLGLMNDNSYTGPTVLNSSIINIQTPNALGGVGLVTVNPGSELSMDSFFSGSVTYASQPLSLSGTGIQNSGALVSNGSNNWTGPLIINGNTLIQAYPENPGDTLNLSGAVGGNGQLTLYGLDGAMMFSGSDDNTLSGSISLQGTNQLWLAKSSGATAIPGPFFIGNTTDMMDSAYVYLGANNQIDNSVNVNIAFSGVFDLTVYNETIGGLTFNGGFVSGNGTLAVAGNITNSPGNFSAYIECGALSLAGQTRIFDTESYTLVNATMIDGGAAAGITKVGVGTLDLNNSNSYSGLTLVENGLLSIEDNYSLGSIAGGTIVTNTGYLEIGGVHVTGESLSLGGTGDGENELYGYYTNVWNGPVILNGNVSIATYNPSDVINFAGGISGSGGLEEQGSGTVVFSGGTPNTYFGPTLVLQGTMQLDKTAGTIAIPGSLEAGNDSDPYETTVVQWLQSSQFPSSDPGAVTVRPSGLLDLNNHNQTLGTITLDTGNIQTESGALTLGGNVYAISGDPGFGYPSIAGQLSLGGSTWNFEETNGVGLWLVANISDGGAAAGFNETGPGLLFLEGQNTFSGPVSVNAGEMVVYSDAGLGAASGGATVQPGAELALENVNLGAEPITLNGDGSNPSLASYGSNILSGVVQLNGDQDIYCNKNGVDRLILNGVVTGTGGPIVNGGGIMQMTGNSANNFGDVAHVRNGTLELAKNNAVALPNGLTLDDNFSTTNYALLLHSEQIADNSPVSVGLNGTLDLNNLNETIGSLAGQGLVAVGAGNLTVGQNNVASVYSGTFTGSGSISKTGTNGFTTTGNSVFTGSLYPDEGTWYEDGIMSKAPVAVGFIGTLGGTGTVSQVVVYGKVSPGHSPGILTTSNLLLGSSSTYAVEINGPAPGNGYDQINVNGWVALGGGALNISAGYSGSTNQQYVIIKNNSAAPVTNTFSGLPEGATLTAANGDQFRISYQGGDGNDVVLTQLSVASPSQIGGITLLPNGNISITGTGAPNLTYTVQANADLTTGNWITIGSATADGSGNIQFTDPNAPGYQQRFYRFTSP
jgi:autotransporter-associated beta strand protein